MTANPRRLDAVRAPGALLVEHCDVPLDMTLGEWRRQCAAERRASGAQSGGAMRRSLRRLLGA